MIIEEALQTLREDPTSPDAWESVVLEVYQPLLAYVASLLFSFRIAAAEDSAHDIVHDVLIAFYDRWPKSNAIIKSGAALTAYLRTSCRNLLIDRYRHEQHAEQFVDFLSLKFKDAFQESDPYTSILLGEIVEMLPPDCASLIKEFINQSLSPAEIAEKMGIPPATFYSRWYRCIARAKVIFSESMKKKGGDKR
jgi:RNA polymerase sigma factor (sigma-70 family)